MGAEKTLTTTARPSGAGEPVWELARLFPPQGEWSEDDYLALDAGQQVEYIDGHIEVLPMPTLAHQRIVAYLYALLLAYLQRSKSGGEVFFAPLPVKLGPRHYREPDLVYLSAERLQGMTGNYPNGADLILEVVSDSPADRARDLVEKRQAYAEAGIPEYWIVDPQEERITVLRLDDATYAEHGRFGSGETATSRLLPGFNVAVADMLAAMSRTTHS